MRKLADFFQKDRRYGYLTGTILAALSLLMWRLAPTELSFLGAGGAPMAVLAAVCGVFAALAFAALIVKLTHWHGYAETVFKRPAMLRLARYLYLLVLLAFAVTAADRIALGFVSLAGQSAAAESNPQGFLASMIYMFWKGRSMFALGVWTTVRIALLGTAVAFVLAMLLVTLRILKPVRQDNDFARFCKKLGSVFSKIYITVIRGTPMMVQALIIYYAGFGLLKNSDLTITEINYLWSAFMAGLITVSLNSTAYLAEVLRGGIESIDIGQTEAARSLGMTNWQTMLKVVFPQAVKNSIPAIGNEFIINIKDSSVLSIIACFDLMFATTSVVGIYYRQLEVYCIAAITYLILTYLSSLLMRAVAKKMDTPAKDLPSSN
ncbi:MAG TPA: amino acid ABC transporter permease [Oscillospiraceae bacterium]|nr:amino acid ABC transporter permease [Oscillospiraceae bacterium]HNW04157.1 amino acid ABC transporter permease [Oscillospiraceae bacterium]